MSNASLQRKIRWSETAQKDLVQILSYWKRRNRSNVYPKKLNGLIQAVIDKIALEPGLRISSEISGVYMKLVRDYWIFYSFDESEIKIVQITSTYQSPDLFYKNLR